MASEKEQREVAKTWTAESLEAEDAIFSFPISKGREILQPAPCNASSCQASQILCYHSLTAWKGRAD